jgi:hypothetical protein
MTVLLSSHAILARGRTLETFREHAAANYVPDLVSTGVSEPTMPRLNIRCITYWIVRSEMCACGDRDASERTSRI